MSASKGIIKIMSFLHPSIKGQIRKIRKSLIGISVIAKMSESVTPDIHMHVMCLAAAFGNRLKTFLLRL